QIPFSAFESHKVSYLSPAHFLLATKEVPAAVGTIAIFHAIILAGYRSQYKKIPDVPRESYVTRNVINLQYESGWTSADSDISTSRRPLFVGVLPMLHKSHLDE